jgi:two-component system response regulator FixJ
MKPIIWIVDDDHSVTDSLQILIESVGHDVETFNSAEKFLATYDPERPGCIVTDERMPGMSGHALQEELVRRRALSPVIVITAHAQVEMAVDAMRLGAVTLIQKPFRDRTLLDAIDEALKRDAEARERHQDERELESRLQTLTARQREVMELVIRGMSNKSVAVELGISERTVELHRSRVLRGMNVGSAAELAFAVGRLRGET